MENNNNVYLKFNFEFGVLDRSTRENLREKLIKRYLDVVNAITVSDLNVLHFGSLSFSFESFDPDELDFQRFDLKFGVTFDDVAFEWISESAVGTVDLAEELELWDSLSSRSFQTIITNRKLMVNKVFSILQLNSLSWTFAIEFLRGDSRLVMSIVVLDNHFEYDRELYADVRVQEFFAGNG